MIIHRFKRDTHLLARERFQGKYSLLIFTSSSEEGCTYYSTCVGHFLGLSVEQSLRA